MNLSADTISATSKQEKKNANRITRYVMIGWVDEEVELGYMTNQAET